MSVETACVNAPSVALHGGKPQNSLSSLAESAASHNAGGKA